MAQQDFEFDFALSFAGEQRDAARQIANILESANIRVFYDEFEQARLLGKDGSEYLADIYFKHARFCVIFSSKDYAERMWPTQERRFAVARAMASKTEYILPVKFDRTEIPGVPPPPSCISIGPMPTRSPIS